MILQQPSPEEIQSVRDKLMDHFDDSNFESFCLTNFSNVFDRFSRGLFLTEKITSLIDHCRRNADEWTRLLNLLQNLEEYRISPRTTREAYLLDLIEQLQKSERMYVHISGEKDGEYPRDRSILDGFIPTNFATVFDRHFLSMREVEHSRFEAIEDALVLYPQFILLGMPGGGKTTILRKLLYDAAKAAFTNHQNPVPVFIRLGKDWPNAIDDMPTLLSNFCKTHGMRNLHPSEMLVILDGLNEIQQQHKEVRIKGLCEWVSTHSKAHVIISCRTNYLLADFLPLVPRIKIKELNDKQIRKFLIADLGKEDAEILFSQLQPDPDLESRRDLLGLARNPYMLSMISYCFSRNQGLTSNQGTLFQVFVKLLYNREKDLGTNDKLTYEDVIKGLGAVAFFMHNLGVLSGKMDLIWGTKQLPLSMAAKSNQLWLLGREMSILQLTKGEQFFNFFHDLIGEYFAAEKLSRSLDEVPGLLAPPVFVDKSRLVDTWDEVFFMMTGIAPLDPLFSMILDVDPFLAAQLLAYLPDAKDLDDEIIDKIIQKLSQYLSSHSSDARACSIKELIRFPYQARVLAIMRSTLKNGTVIEKRAAIKVLRENKAANEIPEILIIAIADRNKWVRRDVADALVELGNSAVDELHSHYLRSKSSVIRQAIVKLWARISSEKSIRYLFAALNDGDTSVSQIASQSLAIVDEDATAAIVDESIYLRRQARENLTSSDRSKSESAIITLSSIGTKNDVTRLLGLLGQSKEKRSSCLIIDALGQLGSTDDEKLVKALIDYLNKDVSLEQGDSPRVHAVRVLGLLRSNLAAESLQLALKDRNSYMRGTAAQALGRLQVQSAVYPLVEVCKNDRNPYVKSNAALALGLIRHKSAIPILTELLSDKIERVRGYSIWALALMRESSLMPIVIDCLNDPNNYVRQCAANGLTILRDPASCRALNNVIRNDDNHYVRQWAALSLGAIGHTDGLQALEYAIFDLSRYVRSKACAAIGEIQHPDSATLIRLAVQDHDQDQFFRQQAALALGRLQGIDHIDVLLNLMDDNNEHVRAAVAQSFGEMKYQFTTQYLIGALLNDDSHLVRGNAAEALGEIGDASVQVIEGLMSALQDDVDFVRNSVVDAIGRLDINRASTRLTEMLESDPSVYVRRKIMIVLAKFPNIKKKRVAKAISSDKDPDVHKIAASSFSPPIIPTEDNGVTEKLKQPTSIASRKTEYELVLRRIEDGELYVVISQAFLEPRRSKRRAARDALWRT